MNKKILFIVLLLLFVVGIGIGIFILLTLNKEPELERPMAEDVTARLVEETLTRTGCVVLIQDTIGHMEYTHYTIDVLEKNKWKELSLKPDAVLPDFEYGAHHEVSLLPNNIYGGLGEFDIEVNWEELYGRLENGEYRIVKWRGYFSDKKYFYIPFTIDDTIK